MAAPNPLQPDIVINGETISATEIAAEAQNHPAPPGKPGFAWRAAARALAVRTLLLQEARRLELSADPEEIAPGRREIEDEALIRAVIERHVSPAPPDEATCRAIYEAHPEQFLSPALYEASHILIPAEPGDADARASARKLAEAFIEEITRDAGAFDKLAAEHSACDSRANGGRLGQVGPGDTVPEFEAALESLKPGATTLTPVETRYGVHVIRLDARADGSILPFDSVRSSIAEQLERTAWARDARALVADLAASAETRGVDLSPAA